MTREIRSLSLSLSLSLAANSAQVSQEAQRRPFRCFLAVNKRRKKGSNGDTGNVHRILRSTSNIYALPSCLCFEDGQPNILEYKCSKVHMGAVTGDWMLEQFVERHDRSVGSSKITGQDSNSIEPQIEIACKTVRCR